MPIGFKLPFDPVKFFTNEYAELTNSKECKEFITSTVECIEKLKNDGIEDSIVLGFNVKVESVKNVRNSDFLVAIDNENGRKLDVTRKRKVMISNDKGAQTVHMSTDEFYEIYPYTYNIVREKFKQTNPQLVAGRKFNNIMQRAKKNPIYAGTLGKHPKSKSKSEPPYSFSKKIFELLDEEYSKKEDEN